MDADVVVIGAGASGLAAALQLARCSKQVIVLEARDRIGGRVRSHALVPGATRAELGAEFIHGRALRTMALLHEAGVTTVATGDESWIRENGDLHPWENGFASSAALFERSFRLPDDESVERFLRRFEGDEAMHETIETARAFVEGFDGADPAIASARAIAQEWASGVDAAAARPIGGYAPMFEHLHKACLAQGVHFFLSTVVRRIAWRGDRVIVRACDRSGDSRTIESRAAVVTLPVGVLRDTGDEAAVEFEPDLPSAKREALRSIEMGHAIKVAMWFQSAFWERIHSGRYRNAAFFRGEGEPFRTYWTQMPLHSQLIVAWVGGPKALAASGASEGDLIEQAVQGFGALFADPVLSRREFAAGAVHAWDRDPFSRGAYSYVAVGGAGARAALAAPVDNALFFAGEATSSDGEGGTVNGALETGERAASELKAALNAARN